MTTETAVRRVAIYVRVSSEDQAERGTIRTQVAEIRRRLEHEAGITVVAEYADEGISGTVLLSERPGGARLIADARRGRFTEVWVYRLDRLGRDLVGLSVARRELDGLGIRLISAVEGEPDEFMFDIQSAVAANERRVFLRRSADGMARAARDGRYCGGIVPFGYRVDGRQETAHLVPDESIVWADQSAADLVRWLYERLGIDGWSCPRIASDLNARGVPTHYERDGRGVRGKRTQGLWRAGRIRNLVISPVYRGEQQYGRRSAKAKREVIAAQSRRSSPLPCGTPPRPLWRPIGRSRRTPAGPTSCEARSVAGSAGSAIAARRGWASSAGIAAPGNSSSADPSSDRAGASRSGPTRSSP